MNKTKIVILKVKKTERTIYDFNILKLDLKVIKIVYNVMRG